MNEDTIVQIDVRLRPEDLERGGMHTGIVDYSPSKTGKGWVFILPLDDSLGALPPDLQNLFMASIFGVTAAKAGEEGMRKLMLHLVGYEEPPPKDIQ